MGILTLTEAITPENLIKVGFIKSVFNDNLYKASIACLIAPNHYITVDHFYNLIYNIDNNRLTFYNNWTGQLTFAQPEDLNELKLYMQPEAWHQEDAYNNICKYKQMIYK